MTNNQIKERLIDEEERTRRKSCIATRVRIQSKKKTEVEKERVKEENEGVVIISKLK